MTNCHKKVASEHSLNHKPGYHRPNYNIPFSRHQDVVKNLIRITFFLLTQVQLVILLTIRTTTQPLKSIQQPKFKLLFLNSNHFKLRHI